MPHFLHTRGAAGVPVSTRILGKAMRDAVRNKEKWKRRRTPTQYPSTDLHTRGFPVDDENLSTRPAHPLYLPLSTWT